MTENLKEITVAGGCFWGVQEYYNRLKGIHETTVGFANGNTDAPVSYKEVCTGETGHTEAVSISYDPEVISLETIVRHLLRFIDPTSLNKQGGDIGTQYRTGVYTTNDDDTTKIFSVLNDAQKNYDRAFVVEVQPLKNYILAEKEHQDYLAKNPSGYCHVDFSVIKPEELKESR